MKLTSLSQVDPSQETRTKKEQLQLAEWGSVGLLEFSQPLKELRHEISRNSNDRNHHQTQWNKNNCSEHKKKK